jgi:hypothetical protein
MIKEKWRRRTLAASLLLIASSTSCITIAGEGLPAIRRRR